MPLTPEHVIHFTHLNRSWWRRVRLYVTGCWTQQWRCASWKACECFLRGQTKTKRAHISADIFLIWRRPPFSNNLPRCHYFHIHRYKLTKQTAWLESFRAPLLPRWLLSCWHWSLTFAGLPTHKLRPFGAKSHWNITDCTFNISLQQSLACPWHKSH